MITEISLILLFLLILIFNWRNAVFWMHSSKSWKDSCDFWKAQADEWERISRKATILLAESKSESIVSGLNEFFENNNLEINTSVHFGNEGFRIKIGTDEKMVEIDNKLWCDGQSGQLLAIKNALKELEN